MEEQRKSESSPPAPPLVLVAAAPQQPVEDAALFQGSEVVDVLCDDGDVAGLAETRTLAAAVVVIGERAEQRVVLVGGEVVPVGRGVVVMGGVRPRSRSC